MQRRDFATLNGWWPMNWDDVRYFLLAARLGSLGAAARSLGTTPSRVSRHIEALEAALSATLFVRARQGLLLTDDGRALLPRAERIEAAALELQGSAMVTQAVEGRVRVATAENLAVHLIVPALPALLEAHPNLSVELLTGLRSLDLGRLEADLAVRLSRPQHGNVTVRRIGHMARAVYRAADRAPVREGVSVWPPVFGDIPAAAWTQAHGGGHPVQADALAVHQAMARSGCARALLPCFMGDRDPALSRDGDIVREAGQDIWLVINSDLKASARVRTVAAFLDAVIRGAAGALAPDTSS
jgi:DNA-binding transcriptional LysR family regulator